VSEPVRVAIVAEASSDANVLVALVEAVAWAEGPPWLREHLETYGTLEGLATFGGEPGERCITWVATKRLSKEHRIRIRKLGDGAFTAEIRKGLAIGGLFAETGVVVVHRDEEGIDPRDLANARTLCEEQGVVLAIPSPCTEAWPLRCAGLPPPRTALEAKEAAGRAGLRDPDSIRRLLHRVDLTPLGRVSDSASFLEQVRQRLLPRIIRG
jgi:hypothetical protein